MWLISFVNKEETKYCNLKIYPQFEFGSFSVEREQNICDFLALFPMLFAFVEFVKKRLTKMQLNSNCVIK